MSRPPRRPEVRPRLLLVTDPAFGDDGIVRCIERTAVALAPGTFGVQLRDKRRQVVSLRLFASRLRLVTRRLGVPLFINGDAVVARDVGADGVHLSSGAGAGRVAQVRAIARPDAWISVATHDDDEVRRATAEGADAVLVSPILSTRASPWEAAKEQRGFGAIGSARRIAGARMLVYGLGGITADTARACAGAGADGVAVVRALLASLDPDRVARAIDDAFARRW